MRKLPEKAGLVHHRGPPKHIGSDGFTRVVGVNDSLNERLRGNPIWERLKVDYEKIFGVKWPTEINSTCEKVDQQ